METGVRSCFRGPPALWASLRRQRPPAPAFAMWMPLKAAPLTTEDHSPGEAPPAGVEEGPPRVTVMLDAPTQPDPDLAHERGVGLMVNADGPPEVPGVQV